MIHAHLLRSLRIAVIANQLAGRRIQDDRQRAFVGFVRNHVHHRIRHERIAACLVAHGIDGLFGEIRPDDMLQADLAAQCVSIGIRMPVDDDHLMLPDRLDNLLVHRWHLLICDTMIITDFAPTDNRESYTKQKTKKIQKKVNFYLSK